MGGDVIKIQSSVETDWGGKKRVVRRAGPWPTHYNHLAQQMMNASFFRSTFWCQVAYRSRRLVLFRAGIEKQ